LDCFFRFPNDFAFEIYFERVPLSSLDEHVREEIAPTKVLENETTFFTKLFEITPPRGGASCFWADKNLKGTHRSHLIIRSTQ
jgi:hypothetical protein